MSGEKNKLRPTVIIIILTFFTISVIGGFVIFKVFGYYDFYKLADHYRRQREYNKAKLFYKLSTLAGNKNALRGQILIALAEKNDVNVDYYCQCLLLHPNRNRADFWVIYYTYEEQKKYQKAINWGLEKIKEGYTNFYADVAHTYWYYLKDYDKAIECCLKIRGSNYNLNKLLKKLCKLKKQAEEGKKTFKK